MRSHFLRAITLSFFAAAVVIGVRGHDARAAWPPAPGADMADKSNWPNDYHGRWNYLSYIPQRLAIAPPLEAFDAKLGAAGLSVDKAWTYTIGRDDVHIGVVDSGIKWEEPELIDRVLLNAAELKLDKRPKTAGGGVCGGAGNLAGYDCNADGIFSVSDYKEDPRISPKVTGEKCFTDPERTVLGAERIMGDLNRNCVLDAGDLILMFSDGVDDDANGYTDDISGWDFFKNDNDPFDDTRYGHGTGEAIDSTAEANNGNGDPGTCPRCRFIPLRVGNSYIADVNDFAKATIYAADNGCKVVQEALGTVNQNAFSKAAIDYAYTKGAIVVASMGDENSRHPNVPATANHVLTVHSVRYDGDNPENSSTYVAFDTCSNYGGHLSLSVSATACSSEATGRSSGIAGLAFSYAADQGIDLSAEETIQLFKMYADDIDVATSRTENVFYWSQPGYDQRFGYGRANASRMMQAIKDKLIPPEVDLTSPTWFAPIFADRAGGLVAVMGRVSAHRAKAYDLKVQWAPGVEPNDDDYKDLVSPLVNVPGTTVSGGTVPLAQLDPHTIDTTHAPDSDSKLNENARTISIRIRAVAHYDNGDVTGEARRVISITNEKNGLDRDLLPGFPLNLGSSIEGSSKLADIDGDGVREAIVPDSGGNLHVLTMRNGTPEELPGFPYKSSIIDGLNKDLSEPSIPSYLSAPAYKAGASGGIDPTMAREALIAAPGIADIDGDGKAEIAFTSWAGTIYVINSKGENLPGWPHRLPLVPSCPLDPTKPRPATCMDFVHDFARGTYSAPVLVDMNKDGRPEIVVTTFDGQLVAFKADGTIVDGYPVPLVAPRGKILARSGATPAVGDLNGDGIPELAVGTNQRLGGGGGVGPIFVVNGRGTATPGGPYLPNWPVGMTSVYLFPVIAEGIVTSQMMGDFDNDGKPEIVLQGNAARPLILKVDPGPQSAAFEEPPNRLPEVIGDDGEPVKGINATSVFGDKKKNLEPDVMLPLFSQPSIGDLDQDGTLDLVTAGGSLSLAGALAGGGKRPEKALHLITAWSGKTGKMFPGMPTQVEDYSFLIGQAVADVSGDEFPEVIAGNGAYFVHAVDACGREPEGFPKFTNGWITATAAVGDMDGDAQKKIEVLVGTRDGYLFAWHTQGHANGAVQWESFHHDNANTGNYATKLDQGTVQHPTSPLNCDDPVPPAQDRFDAAGCSCRAAGEPANARLSAAAVALALGVLVSRRKRR